MPINYQMLQQHCKNGNIAGVKEELLVNGSGSIIDREKLDHITSLVTDLIDSSPDPLFVVKHKVVLELLRNQRIPLLRKEDQTNRKKLYAYFDEKRATQDESAAQRQVCEKFWRTKKPLKNGSRSAEIHGKIMSELKKMPQERLPIRLDGYPARSLILAIVKVIQQETGYPILKFQIGETIISCAPAEKDALNTQRANHWVTIKQLPDESYTYGDWSSNGKRGVYTFLSDFIVSKSDAKNQEAREQQLARSLREKSNTISSFIFDDFNAHGSIRMTGEDAFSLENCRTEDQKSSRKAQMEKSIHYLNGLNFLYSICEVSRRLYRDNHGKVFNYEYETTPADPQYSDNLPMGILQSRSLELVEQGVISLNEIFGSSTIYGKTVWKKGKTGGFYPIAGEGLHRAQYGVATGKSTIANITTTKEKESIVNSTRESQITRTPQYLSAFNSPEATALNNAQSFKEGHNMLKGKMDGHFGDGNESSGDDYSENEDEIRELTISLGGFKFK